MTLKVQPFNEITSRNQLILWQIISTQHFIWKFNLKAYIIKLNKNRARWHKKEDVNQKILIQIFPRKFDSWLKEIQIGFMKILKQFCTPQFNEFAVNIFKINVIKFFLFVFLVMSICFHTDFSYKYTSKSINFVPKRSIYKTSTCLRVLINFDVMLFCEYP